MPNVIKYTTGATETGCLRKGNMQIGNNTADYGATFWNGINPPTGGYTIYLNKASGGPSIYCPANDTQLIAITNQIAGASYTTAAQCLDYFASQTDKICTNFNYEGIVTNGLTLNLDAGFRPSYPTTGTTWYDLSGNTNNGTLTNGPTFNSSYSGSIVFDATNDYISAAASNYGITNQFTIEVVCYPTTQVNGMFNFLGSNGYDRGIMAHWPWSSDYGYLDITSTAGNFYRWYKINAGIQNVRALYHFILYPNGQVVVKQNNVIMTPSGTDTFSGTVSLGTSSTIGAFSPSNLYWGGNMYLFRIYNRALTDDELTQNYNAQKARFGL